MRRVVPGEAAGDDHAIAREALLPAREAGRRLLLVVRTEERRPGVDAVVDDPDLHALAGGRSPDAAPERDRAYERGHGVGVCVVGRDRVDGRHAGEALDVGQHAHRHPQRDRIEHDAVAALHGGGGHIGVQP